MPHLQTPRLQTGVFQTLVTVACGQGVSKRAILKSLVSHVLNFKNWIKIIYYSVDMCDFVINEFNQTFEVQNMANKSFQNASFRNATFSNGNKGYTCLWALPTTSKLIESQ